MFKYGDLTYINNGNAKTLIPRNLTYQKSLSKNIESITTNINNTSETSGNFSAASITDLTVSTLNVISQTSTPNIVISSPIAFSTLKTDYSTNNYTLYPIYISYDMLIKNKNVNMETDNLTIKDNIITLNSGSTNVIITDNITNNVLSGFIFPIADVNISTGYYAGLIYFPNNHIIKTDINSTIYKWGSDNYNIFTNKNKGFFKLKYIPQTVNFSTKQMDNSYLDLLDNTTNLANLQVGSLACGDGEIVSINNTNIIFKISDGINIFDTLTIDKNALNIYNNLAITFIDNLLIKNDVNNFIKLDTLITFYQNILLNNNNFYIYYNNILNFSSNGNSMIVLDSTNNRINLNSTTYVNNIKILSSIELNNIPIVFNNSLQIIGNNITYITFDSINNIITLLESTFISKLYISNLLNFKSNTSILFTDLLSFYDLNNNKYLEFNSLSGEINVNYPININNLYVNSNLYLNNIPLTVSENFIVQNNNKQFILFNNTNCIFFNNIYINKSNPTIEYNTNQSFFIKDTNSTLSININTIEYNNGLYQVDPGISMVGPKNGYQDISNTMVYPTLLLTNTITKDFNLNFIPIDKTFILSGLTQLNSKLSLTCYNVCFQNLMSGSIIGTTRGYITSNICMYNINIWTYLDNNNLKIGYNSLSPINNNLIGDWYINSITIDQPNYDGNYFLHINCIGSAIDKIVWGFKVSVLSI